ncbi:MAG: glycosyltransferase family 4 protein [Myxococcaceae bacterium]
MQVTIVGDYPPPHGGIAVHVKQLHAFLKDAGLQARVLDIGKGKHDTDDVTPVRSWVDYARHVAALASSPEVVHLHISGNNAKAWAVAASLGTAVSSEGRRVLTVHSGLMPAFAKKSRSNRLLIRGAASGYQRVIAVSEAVKEGLVGCGVPTTKLLVHPAFLASQVRPGALPQDFAPMRARRKPLLCFAHHPSKVYGRELMFRALKELSAHYPELGLAVFGPGTHSSEFERDASSFGVTGLIEKLGELQHEQALAVMAASDAFVRPTTADGDAISVREALTLGVPTVASDVCKRPEGARVFKGGDAASLCDAIRDALAHGPSITPAVDAGPFVLDLYRELSPRMASLRIKAAG